MCAQHTAYKHNNEVLSNMYVSIHLFHLLSFTLMHHTSFSAKKNCIKKLFVDTGLLILVQMKDLAPPLVLNLKHKLQLLGVVLQQLSGLKVAQTFKSTLAVTLSALEASFIAEHL